jgi:hypothetical protein
MLLLLLLSGCKDPAASSAARTGVSGDQGVASQDSARKTGGAGSIQGLLQGLPKDKQPKPGPDGTIERTEAKGWLASHVVGKQLDFALKVESVEAEPAGEGKYNVELFLATDKGAGEARKLHTNVIIDQLVIGGVPCQVQAFGPQPLWSDLDTETAKKRRDLKGQRIILRAKISEAEFLEGEDEKQLLLMLGLDSVSLVSVEAATPPTLVKKEASEGPAQVIKRDAAATIKYKEKTTGSEGWVTIHEGPCTILFPARPESSRQDLPFPAATLAVHHLQHDGMEFLALVSDEGTPEMIREWNKLGDANARLKQNRVAAMSSPQNKFISERPFRFGKHYGLEYKFQILPGGSTHQFQAFVIDKRNVTIGFGSTNPNDLTGPIAEKFFQSFKINGKTLKEAGTSAPADKPVTYQGKKYQVFTEVLSWHKAKEACEKRGGRLAVVSDAKHNQFLTELVIDAGLKEAWLGATDEKVEGKWVTVNGSPLVYLNWGPGQPNNANKNEHYLLLWAERGGVWSDQPSTSTQHKPGYVCQWD